MFNRKQTVINPTIAAELDNELNEHEMTVLSSLGTLADLPANEFFATQGEAGREAVIVVTGAADVIRDGEVVAQVGPGAILGESALITNLPRNASIMTTEPSQLAVLNRREFNSFLDQCPRMAWKVDKFVTARSV